MEQTQKLKKYDFEKALKSGYSKSQIVNSLRNNYDTNLDWEKINEDLKELNPKERDETLFDSLYNNQEIWGISGIKTKEPPKGLQNRIPSDNQIQHIEKEVQNMPQWGIESALMPQIIREAINVNVDGFWKMFQNKEEIARENALKNALDKGITQKLEKGEDLSVGEILRYYNANDMKGHFTPQSHYKEQQELKKIAQTNFENLDESQKRMLQKQNLITRLWNSPKELHDKLKDEVTKREIDEHQRARAEQLERDVINIQRTYENILKSGADYIKGSTEQRDKYREMLQESAISLGFDGIGFKGDRIYAFKGDKAIFIDDGFFKNLGQILGTNTFDIAGSITGAIAGAKRGTGKIGKLAGAIAGGAVGAGLGGIADSIIAQYNSRGEFNLADALLTGAESATFDIAGGLIVSGGAKAVKGAVKGTQNLLRWNPFSVPTSAVINSIGSENIQVAKELVEQTFTQEQKDDILAFSKSFGGNLELQGKDTFLTKSAEFLTQKYGADSKIAKVANALEDYSKAHNKAQAREDMLTLIRADDSGQSLGILLEVAKNSTLANKNLREILNATSYKLKKEIESLGLKENAFKEVFKDLSSGTKEDYDEAFNKILGELYAGEKVVLNGEAYAKFREKMGDLIELDPQGMQFLNFVEKGIYNPNGVDFTQLNNAKKLLNSYYTSTNNPSTKDFIKNVVESTIREDINKGVNQIFLSRPEQFENAKKLYDTALSDYSIMRETFKTLDNLGFNNISKTNAQLMDNLINFIQGSGGLKEVDNYALLTKGLKKEQVESLELNALNRIYEKNLIKDSKDSTFEVFNSAKFLEDTAKLREIFQSENAKKFVEIMQGFNRLFGNDATIALRLGFANPQKEGSAIAQSVEGAVQQKIVKGIFGILMRNLPTSNKIIDKLGFKEKVQKMALAYHIEQALKSAYSINDFTFALKKISDDPSTPSPTRQAIIEFSKDLTRLVEDTREKADIDKTAQALKEQDNNTSLRDTIQALKEQRKQELQRAIQEKMAKAAQESQALKAAQQEKQRIKDAQVGKAINEVDLNLQGAIQARALKPTRINLENKSYPAEFVIINKEDLKPNFETKGTQGRTQKQENIIQDIQENLNPNKLFFSEGGFEGLPIILKDGQVSVGNHRAEALKNLSQESLAAYQKSAKEVFGVDLKENELIVRMLDERIPNEEILNLSFASNVGREQNLSEKALSTLGKYQENLDKLPQNIYAQNVEEMQQIVAKSLDKTNNGLNTFDTNLALLSSLAKSKDKNILDALNAISGDAEQKAKVIKMFVENAGNFHNLAKQTQMPNLDLRDYLTQALYFTAKADKSRVENFKELAQEMKSIIQTTDAQGKNALIQEESHYNELIGKALGYSFARFRELENPSGSFFDFLSNIKLALSEELEPTLFSAGRPLSSADIYDFLSVSIKSGIPSDETSEVLELLPQLKAKHEAFKEANTNTQRNGNGNNRNSFNSNNGIINSSSADNHNKQISLENNEKNIKTQGITEEIKQLIDIGAQKGRDMQIIGQENFTPEVVEYVQQQNKKVAIEKLSQEEAEALGFKYPQDVRVTIDSSAINHTLNRHGAESNLAQKSGQKAVSYDDIAKYREYAKNADETLQSVDNGGSNVLVSYKQVNGHFVVVEQIKKKNNELGFKTLFKEQGNYKDSKSYKDTKAKAQTLSIGYEPSANSFASAKSLNSNAIIPQSTKEAIDPANRFAEPFSNELFSALPKVKQAGLLYNKYHQAKGIEAKIAYEKQYNAMLDKIYDFEQKYPVRVSSTQVQVRGNTMPTYKPNEIIDVEIIAQEPSIQKQITYKRHNLRAKAIQSLQVKLEALKPYPQKQIEYKKLESQINTLVEKQHKELRQPSLFEDLEKNPQRGEQPLATIPQTKLDTIQQIKNARNRIADEFAGNPPAAYIAKELVNFYGKELDEATKATKDKIQKALLENGLTKEEASFFTKSSLGDAEYLADEISRIIRGLEANFETYTKEAQERITKLAENENHLREIALDEDLINAYNDFMAIQKFADKAKIIGGKEAKAIETLETKQAVPQTSLNKNEILKEYEDTFLKQANIWDRELNQEFEDLISLINKKAQPFYLTRAMWENNATKDIWSIREINKALRFGFGELEQGKKSLAKALKAGKIDAKEIFKSFDEKSAEIFVNTKGKGFSSEKLKKELVQLIQKTAKKEKEIIKNFTDKLKAYEVKSPRLDSLPSGEVTKSDGATLKQPQNAQKPIETERINLVEEKLIASKALDTIKSIYKDLSNEEIEKAFKGRNTSAGRIQESYVLPDGSLQFKINGEYFNENAVSVKDFDILAKYARENNPTPFHIWAMQKAIKDSRSPEARMKDTLFDKQAREYNLKHANARWGFDNYQLVLQNARFRLFELQENGLASKLPPTNLTEQKAQELQTLKQKLSNADKQTKREILLSCLQEDSKRITDEIMEAMRIAEEKDFLPHEIEEAKNRLSANIPPERKEAIAILHLTEKLKEKIPNLIKEKKQIVKEILYLEHLFSANDTLSLERLAKIEKRVLKSLDEDILENNLTYRVATTEGEIRARELFESCKPDSEQRELFERILPIAQKLNVEIKQAINNKKLSKEADGVYYTGLNSVRVKNNRVTQEKGKVFLHELIHSVTSRAMIAYETGKKELLTPNQVAAIRNIKEIYSDTLKNHKDLGFELESKTKVGDYGLVSSHEFIAELSNPTFREKLKKVGVFEKIVDNILRLFVSAKEAFMLKKNNAYDTLKKNLYAIIDDYKEDFTAAYEMAKIKNTEILQGNRTTQAQIQAKFKFDEKKAKDLAEWHKESHPITKDEQGLPKVFYHGTRADKKFEVFDKYAKFKDNPAIGFWFSDNEKIAKSYAKDNIYKVFLKMKKPFIMYGAVDETTFKEILEIFPEAEEKIRKGIYFQKDKPKLAKTPERLYELAMQYHILPYREAKKEAKLLVTYDDFANSELKVFHNGEKYLMLLRTANGIDIDISDKLKKETIEKLTDFNDKVSYGNEVELLLNVMSYQTGAFNSNRYKTNSDFFGTHYTDYLKAKGYDGIQFASDEFVVFDSNQIKAVENKGLKGESGEYKYFNAESPNIYQSNAHIGSGLVSGSVAGFETDEQGNLNFNPANFLLGLAGGAVGSKAIAQGFKAIHKNPEFKEKLTQELANTLGKGWDSAVKQYPILSALEPRRIIAKSNEGRTLQAKHILKEAEKEEIHKLRESTKQILHNIAGKNITNAHDGRIAQVSKKNIGKMVSDKAIAKSIANGFSAMEHFSAVNDIENLYKNAIFKETQKDNKSTNPNTLIHRYESVYDNEASALITLKESLDPNTKGNKIYSLELEELKSLELKASAPDPQGESLSSRNLGYAEPKTPDKNSESIIPQIQDNETIAKEIVNAIEIPTLPYSEKEINSVLEKYRKAVEADKKQLEPLAPTLSRSDAKALLRADKALFDKYKQYANGKEGEMGIAIMAKQLRDDLNAQINTRNAKITAKATEIEQKYGAIYDEYLTMRKQSQDILDKYHIKTELKDYNTIDNIANLLENGYNINDIQYFINKALKGNELAYNILRNYDTSHTGRGYSGYSMSNNAIDAYANGIKPISKWNSKDAKEFGELIGVKVSLKELKAFLMRCGEKGYHHTSKFYNETKFYSLAEAMSDKNILLKYFPDTKLY